ncbi:hypothetical protein [Rhodobacter capsulatus]|uniref:hypothetical protein n=1 Tax=Rhodobacter capsulatus TaxID=1061 RepID=UPI0003D3175A|nr:hypothetical protein [Rhodobacter capsulatus]ETD01613.1 hypothetical protein U714_10460 [Rhodobacter capsulatus DE442]ETD76680.1 hypothetical protein U717_10615 [Rhodobacter capsulatus R121]ETE53516.1 hypothetical protein U715_10615 [Rhodobacter capsulatus Y262]
MSYQTKRNVRREARTLMGRFKAGKLAPVMAVPVKGSEGGMLSQSVSFELDPIAGRMATPITAEMCAVFVPVQACDALKNPEADYAGMTEIVREKLLSGNPLFVLEPETDVSKRCGVNPRSNNGLMRVNEIVRLAHNCAVNFLRRRRYVDAVQLTAANHSTTPAILSQTVLDRFNGALDPDPNVNGAVQLSMPDMRLPVAYDAEKAVTAPLTVKRGNENRRLDAGISRLAAAEVAAATDAALYAVFGGREAGNVSLTDFYNAQKMDELTRVMRKICDDNPEYGEEMVLRWAHGLSVDPGRVPFLLAEKSVVLGRQIIGATDTAGVEDGVKRSDMAAQLSFTVPIPTTELGGIIVTFACIKPDETLSSQPHPILADHWRLDNFVADELALDPQPVMARELDYKVAQANETTVVFYTGLNELKKTYVSYGLCRALDPNTVESKNAVWQLEVPLSVTPETVLYPADLPQYPFADQQAEVCTYVVQSTAVMPTPMIFGPSPVEQLAVIETEDLFED